MLLPLMRFDLTNIELSFDFIETYFFSCGLRVLDIRLSIFSGDSGLFAPLSFISYRFNCLTKPGFGFTTHRFLRT